MEGEVVGVVEAAAGGQALGEAGEGEWGVGGGEGGEVVGEVVGGGFAFDVGAGGEDDFADAAEGEATGEGGDAEVFGVDVIEGREPTAEDVVEPVEGAGSFERDDVGGLFDDAED